MFLDEVSLPSSNDNIAKDTFSQDSLSLSTQNNNIIVPQNNDVTFSIEEFDNLRTYANILLYSQYVYFDNILLFLV